MTGIIVAQQWELIFPIVQQCDWRSHFWNIVPQQWVDGAFWGIFCATMISNHISERIIYGATMSSPH
jgi:hypothetical protein